MASIRANLSSWIRRVLRAGYLLWLAASDKRVPLLARGIATAGAAYVISPIDLIPDEIPVVGELDDAAVAALALVAARRLIPPPLYAELTAKAAIRFPTHHNHASLGDDSGQVHEDLREPSSGSVPPSARNTDGSRRRDNTRGTILVYRDRIVPRSEASFLGLQYLGFTRLTPVWVGCRTDDGLEALGVQPLILGRTGLLGKLDQWLFKQFGVLPAKPDLAALRPLAIHAHFGRGGALALPIARALHVPLVVTFHGGDASKEKHYRRRLVPTIFQRRLRALQQEASAIICVSDSVRDVLVERGFPPEKLHVVTYGVSVNEIDAAASSSRPSYILFVGRFVEKKGLNHLMEAMRLLIERGTSVPLVLIGDGPLASNLREQARELGDVRFLGWLPNREVRSRMRGAIAVCVPSVEAQSGDAEGLPNVVLEAMAEGVPVIGSRHGGIVEAVQHGRTGLLVPPGDAQAIADSISLLIDDPDARRTMGMLARQWAVKNFNAVDQSRFLEDLVLSVCESDEHAEDR